MLPELGTFAKKMQAAVFISTWRMPGVKISGAHDRHQLARMFGVGFLTALPERLVGEQQLLAAFPDFAPGLEAEIAGDLSDITSAAIEAHLPGAVVDIEDGTLLDLQFPFPTADDNSLKFLYKIWRCNQMRRAYERKHGFGFDVVIRTRPDVLPPELTEAMIASLAKTPGKLVYADRVYPGHVGDQVAVSDAKVADLYASLFSKAAAAPAVAWTGIHTELYALFHASAVEVLFCGVGRDIHEDVERWQPVRRNMIMQLISHNKVSTDVYLSKTEKCIIQAAILVEQGLNSDAQAMLANTAETEQEAITNPRLQSVLARSYEGIRESGYAYVAVLLTWISRSRERPLEAWAGALDIRWSYERVLYWNQLAEPSSAFEPSTAAALLEDGSLPPLLERARNATISSPDDPAIISVLAWLKAHADATLDLPVQQFWYLMRQPGRLTEAVATARATIEISPHSWIGHNHLDTVLWEQGHREAALASAATALACDENHGGLHSRLGLLLYHMGRTAEAIGPLEAGTKLWPHQNSWHWYALALERLGKITQAQKAIANARDHDPHSEELGRTEARLNDCAASQV